jgi:ketosteroid isomerase-like protein
MRGREAISAYFEKYGPELSDIRSAMSDFAERDWGDTGLVTCWLEQTYRVSGEAQQFSGPLTMVLRRGGGHWRVALIHAVPMPPEA